MLHAQNISTDTILTNDRFKKTNKLAWVVRCRCSLPTPSSLWLPPQCSTWCCVLVCTCPVPTDGSGQHAQLSGGPAFHLFNCPEVAAHHSRLLGAGARALGTGTGITCLPLPPDLAATTSACYLLPLPITVQQSQEEEEPQEVKRAKHYPGSCSRGGSIPVGTYVHWLGLGQCHWWARVGADNTQPHAESVGYNQLAAGSNSQNILPTPGIGSPEI